MLNKEEFVFITVFIHHIIYFAAYLGWFCQQLRALNKAGMVPTIPILDKIEPREVKLVHWGSLPSFGEHRGGFLEVAGPDHRLCH